MTLIITPGADRVPGRCAASGSTVGPFVQTGRRSENGYVQLSIPYLKSIAADIGLVDAETHAQTLCENDELMAAVEMLANRVERFDEDIANVGEALTAFAREYEHAQDLKGALAGALDTVRTLSAKVETLESGEGASGAQEPA